MKTELKPCPFCGEVPYYERIPLWEVYNGSTHGYFGCYEYVVKCHNPDCRCRVYLGRNNTIYNSDEDARENAINAWNKRFKED